MSEYRVEATLSEDRALRLEDLPFPAGAAVEVTIVERPRPRAGEDRYPLHGTPIRYERPTDPVEEEWDALQ
jgi:hypothetical protein